MAAAFDTEVRRVPTGRLRSHLAAPPECDHKGLAGAVHAVESLGRHTYDRCDVDDGTVSACHECGRCRVSEAGERRNVQGDNFVHLPNVGVEKWCHGGGAGIVEEQTDALIVFEHILDLGQVSAIAQIRHEWSDGTTRFALQFGSELYET